MTTMNRPLAGEPMTFRLAEQLTRIDSGGGRAITLVKDGPLRVTLVKVGPNRGIAAHHAPGPVTIHAIEGVVTVTVGAEEHTLLAGDVLALGRGVEHAVASAEGGAFLLTVVREDATPTPLES